MKKSAFTIISETCFTFAGLAVANYLGWRESPAFYGINPHPYFAVIILIATRYGTLSGLFSAGVASVSLCAILRYYAGQSPSSDPIVFKLVTLFFITGWIVGEIRQMYINRTNRLCRELEHEKNNVQKLTEKNALLAKVNKEMERRILDEVSTFSSLYETSKQLQSFDIEKIYSAILSILVQYLEADHCSVYVFESNKLMLKESIGDRKRQEVITLDDESNMIARCIVRRKVYSIRDFLENKITPNSDQDYPVMTAPLIKTDGTVLGALVIERMPFFNITGSSLKIFSLLADWVSGDLENALYFQEVQNKNILDEVLNVYTHHYMHTRLKQEFYRSKRYGLPLSIILIKIPVLEKAPVDWQLNMLKFFATTLNTSLRLTDIVTSYKESIQFAMILTMTSNEQAGLAVERLTKIFKNLGIDTMDHGKPLEVYFGIGGFTSTIETMEELIAQAEENIIQCVRQDT